MFTDRAAKQIHPIHIPRMKAQLGRSVPDEVWKNFDVHDFDNVERDILKWSQWFGKMMHYKHGERVIGLDIFASDRIDLNMIRYQLMVKLREQ